MKDGLAAERQKSKNKNKKRKRKRKRKKDDYYLGDEG